MPAATRESTVPPTPAFPPRRPFTTDEYRRLGDAGVIEPDERVELIEGDILMMAPIGRRHAWIVDELTWRIVRQCPPDMRVAVQNAVELSVDTQIQPDFAILKTAGASTPERLPSGSDIALVIEVSDATGRFDRGVKLPIYARAGVLEAWIVDVENRCIEVHLEPGGSGYAKKTEYRAGAVVRPVAVDGIEIDLSLLFGVESEKPSVPNEPENA